MSDIIDDKKEDSNSIPLRDALGNQLSVGSMVNFNPPPGFRNWVGRIVKYHQGGVLLTQGNHKGPTGQTPARVQIVFDVTLSLQPGTIFVTDLIRVVNPESEYIVNKILDSKDKQDPSIQ